MVQGRQGVWDADFDSRGEGGDGGEEPSIATMNFDGSPCLHLVAASKGLKALLRFHWTKMSST